MIGYIEGYSDTSNINYCPECGERIAIGHADGTCTCDECGARFGVVMVKEKN